MKTHLKELISISIILLATITLISQVPTTFASQSVPDKFTDFLKNAVMLEMSNYSVQVISNNVENPPELGGLDKVAVSLLLSSSQSTLYANAIVINGSVSSCSIRAEEGEPEYAYLPTGKLNMAKDFLDRYETFTGDSTLGAMRNMLENNEVKPGDVISGNIRMSVSDLINPIFSWTTTYNGADYTCLQITFQSYQPFFSFLDNRNYLRIGKTDVDVTMDEAISIAQKRLENFTWIIIESDGARTKVPSYNVATIDATLSTQGKADPLVLYPFWSVNCILDKTYPGNVHSVIVEVWADTGDVNEVYPLTMSEWVAENEIPTNPDTNPSTDPTTTDEPPSLVLVAVAVSVTVIVLAAIVVVLVKKRGR